MSHTKGDELTGKKVIVKRGHAAEVMKKNITVRKMKPKDEFPFG